MNTRIPSSALPDLPSEGVASRLLKDLFPPPAVKPTRIVVLGCGTAVHFPWDHACKIYAEASAQIRQVVRVAGLPVEIVTCDAPFQDPVALVRALDDLLATRIDGVILFHAAYTCGEIGAHLGRWLLDHPMPLLSWSWPDPVTGGAIVANSLCCQNFLLGMMARLGVRYVWIHEPVDAPAHPFIERFLRSARARSRFRHGKLLHVGGTRVEAFYDGETDELSVMRRFGLRFDRIDLQTALDRSRKFSDARHIRPLREAILQNPLCTKIALPDAQTDQTLRFGLAILDYAQERGYIGCTVKSWPDLWFAYRCSIDGAVSMLNDYGLCTAEEGEMNGLISSLALWETSNGKAITSMMDISAASVAKNRIGLWHCGASPTRMLRKGRTYEARRHVCLENGDPSTAVGLVLEFLLEPGPVTVTRYQSPDAARCFTFEGNLRDCELAFRGNYGEVEPVAGHTAADVMGTILAHGMDHHWSFGYGHRAGDISMLNHWLGVRELPVVRCPDRLQGFSRNP
ncbi:MAG: fucose isomerase [Opitutaceae bacterium]|jgi:L-fucose isomerase-like protein|nr:fucose isomerase [Opitutaceae bacterium]